MSGAQSPSSRPRLGVLLSGRGSNFVALHDAVRRGELDADIVVVLSNVAEAPGLQHAASRGLDTVAIPHRGMRRREHDQRVVDTLRDARVDWVCLAGYMRLLTSTFVEAFPQRIVNIHPSLLPSFPGLEAQRQAWDYGVAISGCTVHLVDLGMDTGPIVDQAAVGIAGASGPDEVAARILREEHRLYPRALGRLLAEPWRVEGRRVEFLEKSQERG